MKLLSLIFVMLIALLQPQRCYAQETTVKLVALQYPPLIYAENDEIKGVAAHLVREVFAEMGTPIDIEILPWPRALQYVRLGRANAVFTIFKNAEREQYLRYTRDSLIEQEIRFYTRTDQPIKYTGQLVDLAPYRIGITRAVSYGKLFDQAAAEGVFPHLSYVNDEKNKFLLLDKGRVDVVASSTGIAEYYLEKLGLITRISRVPHRIEQVPSYLAFSKASPLADMVSRYEAALSHLKNSGRYQQILAEYGYDVQL